MKYKRYLFWIILLFAFGLRILFINKSLNGDEIGTVTRAIHFKEIFSPFAKANVHSPLQYLIMNVWLSISTSEAWVRLPYVFLGTGICMVVYFIGKEYLNEKFGLLSMLLISFSPVAIWSSQYARSYIFGAFFIAISIYYLTKLTNKQDKISNWIGYILVSSCALYSSYFSILMILSQNIFVFARKRSPIFLKKWIGCQMAIAILYLPWILAIVSRVVRSEAHEVIAARKGFYILGFHIGGLIRSIAGIIGLDPFFLFKNSLSNLWPVSILIIISFSCFVGLFLILLVAKRFLSVNEKAKQIGTYMFFILAFIPAVLAAILEHLFGIPVLSRYFVTSHVAFIFILAAAILFFRRKVFRAILIVLVCVFAFFRLPTVYSVDEDWREIAKYVESNFSLGDSIAFLRGGRAAYGYYSKVNISQFSLSSYVTKNSVTGNYEHINLSESRKLKQALNPYKRVWFVLSHVKVFGGRDLIIDWFREQGYQEVSEKKFNGADIILFANN